MPHGSHGVHCPECGGSLNQSIMLTCPRCGWPLPPAPRWTCQDCLFSSPLEVEVSAHQVDFPRHSLIPPPYV
jgi:hypothetical protein